MRESKIEREVCRQLNDLGYLCIKFADPAKKGAPDRICIGPAGQIFFVEFKAPEKALNDHQKAYHKILGDRGLDVFVVDRSDTEWRTFRRHGGVQVALVPLVVTFKEDGGQRG